MFELSEYPDEAARRDGVRGRGDDAELAGELREGAVCGHERGGSELDHCGAEQGGGWK
jgi:hypothetical protein